jgi:hypothetical protein
MRKFWLGAAAASTALLVALTGCGGTSKDATKDTASDGKQAAPADLKTVLVAAVKKTDEKSSARMTVQMTLGSTVIQAEGVMRYTAPLLGKLDMTMNAAGQRMVMHALYTREAMYMSMPGLSAQLGKKWMRMGYADLEKAAGSGLGKLLQQQLTQGQDFRKYLKLLVASQDLQTVGTETVGGVSTTHYRGTIDALKALSDSGQLAGLSAADRKQLKQQFAQLGLRTFKADIWVDGDGYLRRIRETAKTAQGAFDVRMDMSDFGVAVNVSPPPSADVRDFGEVLGQLGGARKG